MTKIRAFLALLALLAVFPVFAATSSAAHPGKYYGGKATEYPAWFKDSFLNLKEDVAEAARSGKRVMLMFTQDNCPYCNLLVERNLAQREIEAKLKDKFDVIVINIWGDREMIGLDGKPYTEKIYSAAQKIQFTPSLFFFDETGNTVLRLNGYVAPDRFKAALDWVAGHEESAVAFRDFVAAREALKSAAGDMIAEDFFLKKPFDLRRRGKSPRPLAVFLEQKDCPECEVLHRRVLADPELRAVISKFDNAQLDMWSSAPIINPSGERLPVREWVKRLGVNYAPGIVLFDAHGREVIRWESGFRVFHTLGMFDYVQSGGYRTEPNFQRFLSAKSEHLRNIGRDVNIWRYADEPLTLAP